MKQKDAVAYGDDISFIKLSNELDLKYNNIYASLRGGSWHMKKKIYSIIIVLKVETDLISFTC